MMGKTRDRTYLIMTGKIFPKVVKIIFKKRGEDAKLQKKVTVGCIILHTDVSKVLK